MLLTTEGGVQNYHSLLQRLPLAIIVLDSQKNVRLWNFGAEKMFGWKEEEIIGHPFPIIPDFEAQKFSNMFTAIMNGRTLPYVETKRITKNGPIIDVSITPLSWYDAHDNVQGYTAVIKDITDYKQMERKVLAQQQRVEQILYFDFLTGLPNQRLFIEKLKQKLDSAKSNQSTLTLLFLDLDGFKVINDTLGHKIGDKLLKEVTFRLKQMGRVTEFLSRIDGDEFAIILENTNDIDEIHHIAQQLLTMFEVPFFIDTYELFITTSIGISVFPHGGNSTHDLIKNAELAMYRAKDEGKNKYEIFSTTMNTYTYKKFSLQRDLRKAVQEKQIFLMYQPRIDSSTNKIVGAEALARWNHPEWGFVPPGEFISLAEESGLIHSIGEQLLLLACSQNKKWQNQGFPPIKMSVNFSALQFSQANIIETIENVLHMTRLDPKWLEIEITETVVMKNEVSILTKLEQIKAMGISIALDDFGTGYSSLSYLKKIKPNTVKIDKSFIQRIPLDTENVEIVAAIISLSEKLKFEVVAEGVETNQQYMHLRNIHCNELQGYFFSKPVATEEFEKLLCNRTCFPHRPAE